MKIVTLNPPYFPRYSRQSRSPAVTKSDTLYYPFYLSYATGVLEDAGFDVTLIDSPAMNLNRKDTLEKIKLIGADLVVCETSTPSIENDLEVIKDIKNLGVSKVIAVGTHVTALTSEVLGSETALDLVARHEYEYTVRDVAKEIEKNGYKADFSNIRGLAFRMDNRVVVNQDREYIHNLDDLPFVSRVYKKHLKSYLKSYFYGANLYPVVTILSGRGCPHQCAFCVYPQTMSGNKYRLRSVDNIVNELEYIKRELPEVKEVFIEDDTLTVNSKRAREISKEIIKRDLKIKWSTNSRADADYETMRLMSESGCRLLCVGFESGSQEILDTLGKNIKRENYFRFRKDAEKAGLLIHGCFMYGNEGETKSTMRETLELAKKLNCDSAQFYPIMVYPGTIAYNKYKIMGYINTECYRDWLTDDGQHNCVVDLPNISKEELVSFCDESRKDFYLRPDYFFYKMKQCLKHPNEFKRNLRAAKTLVKHMLRV